MTYPATGGGGLMGNRVVAQLVARGETVAVFDKAGPPPGVAVPAGVDWTRGDVGDPRAVTAAIEQVRPSRIIHTAFAINRAD